MRDMSIKKLFSPSFLVQFSPSLCHATLRCRRERGSRDNCESMLVILARFLANRYCVCNILASEPLFLLVTWSAKRRALLMFRN